MKIKTFIVAFLVLIFSSCVTYRGERVERKHKRLKTMSDAKIYKKVVSNYLQYNNINLKKITISYEEGNKKHSFRGSVRILKDSIIWLSISKMGIEGMRIKLTPDSVAFVDRLHREYMVTDYNYLNQRFNLELDYFLIQSILTNQLPEYRISGNVPFFRHFKGKKTKTHYVFHTKSRRDKQYWKRKTQETGNYGSTWEILRITPDLMRLESIDIFETQFSQKGERSQSVNFNLKYEAYKKYNEEHLFPEKMIVTVKREQKKNYLNGKPKTEKIMLTIVVDKLEINDENLSFPFHISSKYKQINE